MKHNQSAISSAEQVACGDDVGTTCSVLRLRREDFAGSVGRKLFVCVDWDGNLEFFSNLYGQEGDWRGDSLLKRCESMQTRVQVCRHTFCESLTGVLGLS